MADKIKLPKSAITKGRPGKFTTVKRTIPRPVPLSSVKKGTLGTFQTEPRPPGATATTLPTPQPLTPAPNAPAAISPFLTPEQIAALAHYDEEYGYNIAGENRTLTDAGTTANADLAAAAREHLVNTDTANQTMAARGLFQSSIRDSDLNDLDATLALRNNNINTALNRAQITHDANIGKLMTDWTTTHNFYNALGVQNAQAQTPVLPEDQSTPTPAPLSKGTLGTFQTEPRPPGATPATVASITKSQYLLPIAAVQPKPTTGMSKGQPGVLRG